MHYTKKISLVIFGIGLTSCASDIPTTYMPVNTFDTAGYCSIVDRTSELVIPQDILDTLEDDSTASAAPIVSALLTKAAMEVAHASEDEEGCHQTFADGEELFLQVLRPQQESLNKVGSFKPSKDPEILNVQTEITRLWREDQSARGAYIGLGTEDKSGADFWAHRRATAHAKLKDNASRKYIESLMDSYDWIDKKRFGSAISEHAWLLVQHADDDPELQTKALKRMEPYLESGGIKPANYAYLWDRVAVNTGRKQRYGTQPTWECDENKKLTLQPLENPETVNERRAALKMGTVEKSLEEMARGVCR